jgi:HlyD family secretion protein
MTSQVSIVTSSAPNSVAVPIQAVIESGPEDGPKKKVVYTVADGKAKEVAVQTGISDATHVAIVSGIKAGDAVITGPFRTLKKLKDGMAVTVTKEETKASDKKDKDKDKE